MSVCVIVGVSAAVAQPCTPPLDVELDVDVSSDLATAIAGDLIRLTGTVHNSGLGTAHLLRFELRGGEHLLEPLPVIGNPTGDQTLQLEGGSSFHLWINRIAAHVGTAPLVLAVRYRAPVGCVEEPQYEDRTAVSTPLEIAVEPSTACWGDCDDSGDVTVDEIQRLVGIALGDAREGCPLFVPNPDGSVSVDELVTAISNALVGCPRPRSCGGPAELTCPGRSWCEFPPGDCGTGGGAGTCIETRTLCYPFRRSVGGGFEVCGCNQTTYLSDCARAAARVSKAYDGFCR